MPKLLIVIASTRPGRVGLPVANWFIQRATEHGQFELEVADLAQWALPFGYPAPLKNAIDYLNREWHYKPVGFVSYGGIAAGTRSVQQLKQVVTELRMLPAHVAVQIPFVVQFLDEHREFMADDVMVSAASDMLDELVQLEAALRPLRRRG